MNDSQDTIKQPAGSTGIVQIGKSRVMACRDGRGRPVMVMAYTHGPDNLVAYHVHVLGAPRTRFGRVLDAETILTNDAMMEANKIGRKMVTDAEAQVPRPDAEGAALYLWGEESKDVMEVAA